MDVRRGPYRSTIRALIIVKIAASGPFIFRIRRQYSMPLQQDAADDKDGAGDGRGQDRFAEHEVDYDQ